MLGASEGLNSLIQTKDSEIKALKVKLKIPMTNPIQTPELLVVTEEK